MQGSIHKFREAGLQEKILKFGLMMEAVLTKDLKNQEDLGVEVVFQGCQPMYLLLKMSTQSLLS